MGLDYIQHYRYRHLGRLILKNVQAHLDRTNWNTMLFELNYFLENDKISKFAVLQIFTFEIFEFNNDSPNPD